MRFSRQYAFTNDYIVIKHGRHLAWAKINEVLAKKNIVRKIRNSFTMDFPTSLKEAMDRDDF